MSKRGREAEAEAGAEAEADTPAAPIPTPLAAQHGLTDEQQEEQQHRAAALRGLILAEGGGVCCTGGGGGGGCHQHQRGDEAGAEIVRMEGGEAGPDAAAAAWMVSPSLKLPQGVILHVLSFLDGRALAACAQVCRELYEASDYAELWATAARAAYPQAAVLGDKQSYGGEWKALLRDGNRRNRSALFEWEVANCLGDARRRYSPAFELEDYTFQLIVDPNGNPYVPLGHPGVSVYLTCCPTRFVRGVAADGRLEVDIVATNQPFPPPAPQEEDEEEPPPPPPQRVPWECCCAFGLAVLARPQAQQQGQQGGPGPVRRDLMWTSNLHEDRFDNQTREWGVHRLISLRRLREPNNGYLDEGGALRIQARLRLSHYRVKLFTSEALKAHKDGFGVANLAYRGSRLQPPTRSLAAASAAALAAATNLDVPPTDAKSPPTGDETAPLFWTYDVFQSTTVAAFTALVAKDLGLASPARLRLWAVTQPWADSPSAPRELLRPLLPPDHPLAILHQQVLAQQGLGPAAVGALLADQEMTLAVALHAHQDGVGEVRVWAEVSGDGGWQWSDLAVGVGEPEPAAAASVGMAEEEQEGDMGPQEAAWTGANGGAAGAAMQVALDAAEVAADMEEAAATQEEPPLPPSRRWKRVCPPRLVATAPGGPLSAAVRILPDPQDPLEIAAVAAEVVAYGEQVQEQQAAEEQGQVVDPNVVPPPLGLMVLEQPGAEPALHVGEEEQQGQQQDVAVGGAQDKEGEGEEDDYDDDGQPPLCVLLFIKHLRLADPNNATRQQPLSLEYLTHVFLPVTAPVRALFDALVPLAAGVDADPSGFSLMVEAPPSAWQPAPEPTTPPITSTNSSSNDIAGGGAGAGSSSSLGHPTRLRCFDCPPSPAAAANAAPPTKKPRHPAPAKPPRTVRALRVENGQILVLHRKGQEGTLRGLYQGFTEQLLKETAALLAYTGPSAGVEPRACPVDVMRSVSGVSVRPRGSRLRPRTSADALVDLFERLGNQRFRVRNTALERQHTSARETLEYASVGRHLGFCCDRCGATDFTGPRYKCTRCVDYDLCYQCRVLPVERHRYRFGGRRWMKEEYGEHNDSHTMVVIQALPHDAGLLRLFAPV